MVLGWFGCTQMTASMRNVEHLAAQLSQLVGTATFTAAAPPQGLAAAAAAATASSVTGTSTSAASYASEARIRTTLDDVSRLADDLASLMPDPVASVQGAAVAAASDLPSPVPETQGAEAQVEAGSCADGASWTSAEVDARVSELASEPDLGSSAAASSATAGAGRGGSDLSESQFGSGSVHSQRGPSSVTRHSPSGSGATTASASSASPAASVASAVTASTSSSASYHLQPQKRTTRTSDDARFLMPPPPPIPSTKAVYSSAYDDVRSSTDLLAWASAVRPGDTGATAEALRLQDSGEAKSNNGNNAERGLLTLSAGSGMGGMLWEESSIGSEAPPDAAAVDDAEAGNVEEEKVGSGSEAPAVSFIERYMQKRKAGATEVEAYHQASEEEAAAMKAAGGAGNGGES